MKVYSPIVAHMRKLYPELLQKTVHSPEDSNTMFTVEDLLCMVLYTYSRRSAHGQPTAPYDVMCDFPGVGCYKSMNMQYSVLNHLQRLMGLLIDNQIMDVKIEGSCTLLPSQNVLHELIIDNQNSLTEKQFNKQEASEQDAVKIANLLLSVCDEAVDDIIAAFVVRVNKDGSSAYNTHPEDRDVARFSNHWNTTAYNRLDGTDGTPMADFWHLGWWDKEIKKFKSRASYPPYRPNRTVEEEQAVIDKLIDNVFVDNPLAVAKLQNLKRGLEGTPAR